MNKGTFSKSPGVQKNEFKRDALWVLRQKRQLLAPGTKVRLLDYLKRGSTTRVKIRHQDGELKGLEEFVPPGHLEVPWAEWNKVQRDEKRELALQEYLESSELPDNVTCAAANVVFAATSEGKRSGYPVNVA